MIRIFSTEFPVEIEKPQAAFVAQAWAWLRGVQGSTVLEDRNHEDVDGASAELKASTGETFRMREFSESGVWRAIGFRHEIPDGQGRLWRTEAVLNNGAGSLGQHLLRVRTQCVASVGGTISHTPRKPYIVKSLLRDGWGGHDAELQVLDEPVWLEDNKNDLALASNVMTGESTGKLPVVYLSTRSDGSPELSESQIEKLAFELGGVAHVLVEPNRNFSFGLRDTTIARNVYGGAIGICLPGQGVVRRLYLGGRIESLADLRIATQEAVVFLRSQMPAIGWDWTDLIEQAARADRLEYRQRIKATESEAQAKAAKDLDELIDGEIASLKDRICELDELLVEQRSLAQELEKQLNTTGERKFSEITPEFYEGEIQDRLLLSVKLLLTFADKSQPKPDDIDARTIAVLKKFLEKVHLSPAFKELQTELKVATGDSSKLSQKVPPILRRHGYTDKSQNNHLTFSAKSGFEGLPTITLVKTSSDYRAGKNTLDQLNGALGLKLLKKYLN